MMNFVLLCGALMNASPGETWPAFRGSGNSISDAQNLPLVWSNDEAVAWTIELPGYGQSSPVVWNERIFVTSALGDDKAKVALICIGLDSGEIVWSRSLASSQAAKINGYISVAAPTPAVDENRVYAFFETGDLIAYSHEGEQIWQRSLTDDYGPFLGNHGLGSSLAISPSTLFILVCHDGPSYLLAVDPSSGKTIWKAERPARVSWSSPIAADDGAPIVISSNGTCEAIDAKSGEQLWLVENLEGNTVPSATVTKELIVVGSSQPGFNLAIRRGGSGNVTNSHIRWRSGEATATFSSPLVYAGHVYMVNRTGVAFCLNAADGETVWKHRLGGSCWASPLGACGRVYFFEKSGKTSVVAAGPELQVLATNEFPNEDRVYGVAAVNNTLILRTGKTLTRIGHGVDQKEHRPAQATSKGQELHSSRTTLPDLPRAITSFGATVDNGWLYVYGGHFGTPHHYSAAGQSNALWRLNLQQPESWEQVATGPKLQGLALVAHGGSLYRVGGFTARNKEEEDKDLWSRADFARFDTASRDWHQLPPLPVAGSSFDAVVVEDKLYVAGGWAMRGKDEDAVWHDSAHVVDLSTAELTWQELPTTPFHRRAVSLGSLRGKIYVIGGIGPDGKTTTRTAIFDPTANRWSEGPSIPGDDMEGFGTACDTVGDQLLVSTISGNLLRLAEDGKSWQVVKKLNDARFFHQMLPLDSSRLMLIAGANMESGKFSSIEVTAVDDQQH